MGAGLCRTVRYPGHALRRICGCKKILLSVSLRAVQHSTLTRRGGSCCPLTPQPSSAFTVSHAAQQDTAGPVIPLRLPAPAPAAAMLAWPPAPASVPPHGFRPQDSVAYVMSPGAVHGGYWLDGGMGTAVGPFSTWCDPRLGGGPALPHDTPYSMWAPPLAAGAMLWPSAVYGGHREPRAPAGPEPEFDDLVPLRTCLPQVLAPPAPELARPAAHSGTRALHAKVGSRPPSSPARVADLRTPALPLLAVDTCVLWRLAPAVQVTGGIRPAARPPFAAKVKMDPESSAESSGLEEEAPVDRLTCSHCGKRYVGAERAPPPPRSPSPVWQDCGLACCTSFPRLSRPRCWGFGGKIHQMWRRPKDVGTRTPPAPFHPPVPASNSMPCPRDLCVCVYLWPVQLPVPVRPRQA